MPPAETFKGLSYGDWVAIWSNWFLSRDVDSYQREDVVFLRGHVDYKPVNDSEGAMRYQDPKSFLDRTGDKKLKILKGTPVFVPIAVSINAVGCDFEGKHIENENDLRSAVNKDINHISSIWATIKVNHAEKGIKIVPDLRAYRVETPLFKLTVPEDSALNDATDYPMKSGNYDAVAEGYFILLLDLTPSTYQINFGCHGPGEYWTKAVYDVTVYRDTRKEPSDVS